MYHIAVSSTARKDLQNSDKPTQKKVDKALLLLGINPFRPNTQRLTNHPDADYRYRIGNYRILFDIDQENQKLFIHHIWPRGKDYKK